MTFKTQSKKVSKLVLYVDVRESARFFANSEDDNRVATNLQRRVATRLAHLRSDLPLEQFPSTDLTVVSNAPAFW